MSQTAIGLLLDASGKPDWQVAAQCEIHPSVMSHYRLGRRTPHTRHAESLATFFGCAPEVVLGPPSGVPYELVVKVVEVAGPIDLQPLSGDSGELDEWIEG